MSTIGPDILAELLDAHGPALVLYARQWTRRADDVVQEAFVRLAGQPALPECPRAWLYHAVRNGAISAARADARRTHHETAAAWRGEPWFTPVPESGLDAAAVTASLAGLPADERETIVARLWGGLSFEEIAQLTQTSTSTAHRRYQAGIAALRERFSPCPEKKN